MANPNALQWDGAPGHYEVYYVSLTDAAHDVGVWLRLTMLAPLLGDATCSLWFMAMDSRNGLRIGRKTDLPIDRLVAAADPFSLRSATRSSPIPRRAAPSTTWHGI